MIPIIGFGWHSGSATTEEETRVSGEPPTQYENVPIDLEIHPDPVTVNRWENPPVSTTVVRAYQPVRPTPPPPSGASRRTVLGVLVGVATVGGLTWLGSRNESVTEWQGGYQTEDDDPFDDANDEPDDSGSLDLDGQSVDAPPGWTVDANTGSRGLLHKGDNQVLLVVYGTDATTAIAEIASALERSNSPLVGTASTYGTQTRDGAGVTLSGTGKYQGKGAREVTELRLDTDNSRGLFIRQILTAPKDSTIAKQAASLASGLRGDWPW
jgi:hypothetical protein